MDGAAIGPVPAGGPDAPAIRARGGTIAPKDLAQLEEIGRGFESIFASTLLSELLAPLADGGGIAGNGPGASVVEGLLEQNLAEQISKGAGLGIGRMVVTSMKPLLETKTVSLESLRGLSSRPDPTKFIPSHDPPRNQP